MMAFIFRFICLNASFFYVSHKKTYSTIEIYFPGVFITSCCAACRVGCCCSMPATVQPIAVTQPNVVIYNPQHNANGQYQNNAYNPYGLNQVQIQQVPVTVAVATEHISGVQEDQTTNYAEAETGPSKMEATFEQSL